MHDQPFQQGVQTAGDLRPGEAGEDGPAVPGPLLCQRAQRGIAQRRKVQFEAQDRAAAPGWPPCTSSTRTWTRSSRAFTSVKRASNSAVRRATYQGPR